MKRAVKGYGMEIFRGLLTLTEFAVGAAASTVAIQKTPWVRDQSSWVKVGIQTGTGLIGIFLPGENTFMRHARVVAAGAGGAGMSNAVHKLFKVDVSLSGRPLTDMERAQMRRDLGMSGGSIAADAYGGGSVDVPDWATRHRSSPLG